VKRDFVILLALLSLFVVGCKVVPLDNIETLEIIAISPRHEAVDVPTTPVMKWMVTTQSSTPLFFDVYLSTKKADVTTENKNALLIKDFTGTSYLLPFQLEYNTIYYWKVVAFSKREKRIVTSPVWSFKTIAMAEVIVEPVQPQNGAVGITLAPMLSWKVNKQYEGMKFDVYLSDDRQLVEKKEYAVRIAASLTTSSYTIKSKLSYSTLYYWRVVVKLGTREYDGPIWCFTTQGAPSPKNHPPDVPSNPSPTNGQDTTTIKPVLSWYCSDPDGDVLVYDLYMSTNREDVEEKTRWSLIAESLPFNSYSFTYSLEYATTYYWRVVAKDNKGGVTSGPVWNFTTSENTPPSTPSTPTPVNGAKNVEIRPVLTWQCYDPNGEDLWFDIYLSREKAAVVENLATARIAENIQEKEYQIPENLELSTTYYWKIIARDKGGNKVEGPVWNFTTRSNAPPEVPFDPSPADNTTNLKPPIALSWKCSDPDGDELVYDLYFSESIQDVTEESSRARIAENMSTNQYVITLPLKYETTYYWKVVAKDTASNTTASPIWKFTTQKNNPPSVPANPFPSNGEKNVVVRLTLSWQCSDPDRDALKYDVYLSKNKSEVYLKSFSAKIAVDYATNTLAISEKLDYDTTYYWRVIAKDNYDHSVDGPIWSFTTIKNTAPTVPSNPSPAHLATNIPTRPRLSWKCDDPDGEKLSFDVYISTEYYDVANKSPSARVFSNITNNSVKIENDLKYRNKYYWKVVAKDESGNIVEGPIWIFITKHSPDIMWKKLYGGSNYEVAKDIKRTSDGNFVVVGYSYSNNGNVGRNFGSSDIWVVKLDENGNLIWSSVIGGSKQDEGYSISPLSDSGYVVAGMTYSDDALAYGNNNHGGGDAWIIKLDADGIPIWQKAFGGIYKDVANVVIETTDGSIVFAGYRSYGTSGPYKAWIVKLDSEGTIIWEKIYDQAGISYIKQTEDGGYIVGASSNMMKLDANGNMEWSRYIGALPRYVQETGDGGYLVVATAYRKHKLVKLDSNGNIEWEEEITSPISSAYSIDQTADGGFIIAGTNSSEAVIMKIDKNGNILWDKTLGDYTKAYAVQTVEDGYVVAGEGRKYSNTSPDFLLLKLER